MTKGRFTIESDKINSTYSIHIRKDGEVIFEICNWNSLSEMHKTECEEIVDLLNEQDQQIKELKEDLNGCNKTAKNAIDFIRGKNEICKDVLQKHYDYAYNEKQKNLDDAIVAAAYGVLLYTVSDIADELGIKIKK